MNAVISLSEEEAARGVVTHSSGNHAGAVALAARTRGIPAQIVVPYDTPKANQLNLLFLAWLMRIAVLCKGHCELVIAYLE